jgi:hypothetical protein
MVYIYSNIGGILMGSMLPYIPHMDPMGNDVCCTPKDFLKMSHFEMQFQVDSWISNHSYWAYVPIYGV